MMGLRVPLLLIPPVAEVDERDVPPLTLNGAAPSEPEVVAREVKGVLVLYAPAN